MHGAVLETVIIFEEAGSISKVDIRLLLNHFCFLTLVYLRISTIVNHYSWVGGQKKMLKSMAKIL